VLELEKTLSNVQLKGDETERYDWFRHGDMGLQPYVTVDLEGLSSHMTLMNLE